MSRASSTAWVIITSFIAGRPGEQPGGVDGEQLPAPPGHAIGRQRVTAQDVGQVLAQEQHGQVIGQQDRRWP
jgi:hypothetical protein